MKMCLVVNKGRLRFRSPVYQRKGNREAIKPALVSAMFVAWSLFMVFDGESSTLWWAWVPLSILGLVSAVWWLVAFFPFPLKSEKAERILASCLTSDHLDQIELVFKEAVSNRLSELSIKVVDQQKDDPTCDPPEKEEFRQLFDAAKTLRLIGPVATYGDFFRPATKVSVEKDAEREAREAAFLDLIDP